MPNGQVRVVGSGYTTFNYNGKPIAFMQQYSDSGTPAIGDQGGAPFAFITPLGATHPVEIANSSVLQGGTLSLTLIELWSGDVWTQLDGLASAASITDVWALLARSPGYVTCQSIITPPGGSFPVRGKTYHNCKVVGIDDGDTVAVGSLIVQKGIVVAYTHSTKI
jgi:hypothetical protein